MSRFSDKTVLITGAAGALGENMVRRFAADGAVVVVGARRGEQIEDLIAEIGNDSAVFAELDVTDEAAWAAAVETAVAAFGGVDVLVNNAARIAIGTTESIEPDELRAVLETNLVGAFLGTRAVIPWMRAAGGGVIVNVNSISGLLPAPGLVAYGTSKWAIRGFTQTVAKELARDNIRVNGVFPGIIETPLAYDPSTGKSLVNVDGFAIPRYADVNEITNYVLFAASAEFSFATGTELVVDGGYVLGPLEIA